jgi:hypothetical protein
MRTLAFLLIAALPVVCAPMTKGERQRLIAHLDMTNAWLKSEVAGLSAAQLSFRPAPDAWSVSDVVEHLAIAEPQYWKQLQDGLGKPRAEEKGAATDEQMLWYGIDRTNKQKTGEARVPKGQFESAAKTLESWSKLRGTMLEFAKTSEASLRDHDLGPKTLDCYQWFLMISSHSQRHIMQIREIKAAAGYPR